MYECDIVFLFDTSGSMGSYISKVKNVVENFTNDLQNYDVDYRLGIVTFEKLVHTYDFTDDVDEFKDTVNSILKTNGGYEYGLTAIKKALDMNFRDGVGKYFIMLTDERYEERKDEATKIINQLKNNNVRLDVIGLSDYSCTDAYKPITDATGGGFYDINGHMPKIFQNITGVLNVPSDAFVYNGHSYYVYSDVDGVNSWENAKTYCESQGGYLAVIDNSAENTALYNYITIQGHKNAYFGLTDSKNEGTWEWVTGDSVSYTNWGSIEPNSERSDEDYAEFYYKYTDGKWNDGNFGNGTVGDSKTFICEWDTIKNSGESSGGGENNSNGGENSNGNDANSGGESANTTKQDNQTTDSSSNSARTFYLNPGYHQGEGYKYEGGLFVTNFNFDKNSNGGNSVTFDVYNTKDANGIVEYYDENGKFIGADSIAPHSAVIKDFSSWWEKAKNTFGSIAKYGFGNVPITDPSVSKHTRIKDVPTGTSKIIVTNNQTESIYAYAYNIVDNYFSGMKIVKSLKKLLKGYEAFKSDDSKTLFIDQTKGKIVEQLVQKLQESVANLANEGKFSEVKIEYDTGASLLKKLKSNGIKELILQDFDLQKAFENALGNVLEYVAKNSEKLVIDQVTGIAMDIGSKLLAGNPAIFGLQAMSFIGNALDGLSKFLTQKLLEKSKPMIFQLGVSQSDESNSLSPLNDSYGYSGGNKNITDYVIGEKVELRSDFTGIGLNDTDFMVNSSSGALTIKNARDKVIDVAVGGNTVAYAYLASSGGEINGSDFSQYEVIIGGNNAENQITAGSGGSSLWGGAGGNDILTGGAGQDNFFYGKNDGADIIQNASSSDIINLYDVSLADITSANVSGSQISVNLNTGNNLQINSAEILSSTFNLADGSWKFNHSSGNWQSA